MARGDTVDGGGSALGLEGSSRPAQETKPTVTVGRRPDRVAGNRLDREIPLDASCELPRGVSLGRYVVVGLLGAGGMGRVYAAYDPQLDRKVALKLLRDSRQEPFHRARLAREAQAMARLSHPNVITVLDVGTMADQVFVAMEYVKGVTLRAWVHQRARDWREILSVFVSAGRGLAAAHRAGLVHRDFKPSNVLVGDDGRVRVTDFGLARALSDRVDECGGEVASEVDDNAALATAGAGETLTAVDADACGSLQMLRSAFLEESLTTTGTVLGTPRYMAPEQHAVAPTDPRTDQFAFCVALYEALYREHPFDGDTSGVRGPLVPPPRVAASRTARTVPARIRQALLRGMSIEPSERYPTMSELLGQLERAARTSRRRALVVLAGLAAVAGVGLGYGYARTGTTEPAGACTQAADQLRGVWDAPTRRAGEQVFLATSLPYAADTWARVEHAVDGYLREWVDMRTATCLAAQVERVQSLEAMDLRTGCLDTRLSRLRALIEVFSTADATVVEHAVEAIGELPPVADCADVETLRTGVQPPPPDQVVAVATVRQTLARTDALAQAGKYAAALELAVQASAAASSLDYLPLAAEASLSLGRVHRLLEHGDSAAQALREAVWSAEACGYDQVAADGWTELIYVLRYNRTDYQRARDAARHAEALITLLDDDNRRVSLLFELGVLHRQQAKYQQAAEAFEQALALCEASPKGPCSALDRLLLALADTLSFLGRGDEAVAHLQRSTEVSRDLLGTSHPLVGNHYHAMGLALEAQGDYARAADSFERARALWQTSLGPDHPNLGHALLNLGNARFEMGEYEQAVAAHRRALAIWSRTLGATHFHTLLARTNLGEALAAWGKCDEARQELDGALAGLEADPSSASHLAVGYALTARGQCAIAASRPLAAVADLERALEIREANPEDPRKVARTQFLLAQALHGAHRAPDRALRLARSALAAYAAGGERFASKRAEVATWLQQTSP